MNIDSVIFDLDGVLWDTCETCAIAWNNVIKRNNIEFRKIVCDDFCDDLRKVTGKPHGDCIKEPYLIEALDRYLADQSKEIDLLSKKLGKKRK